MDVNKIIEKFNYDMFLATMLRRLYPILVEYFKDEHLVFEALYSTPIVFSNDIYECMVNHNLIGAMDSGAVADENLLRRAVGGYICEPVFKYNSLEKKYELEEMKRMIALNINRLKNTEKTFVIIHEISHLIKSYYHECVIKEDTAVIHSGLIKWYYQLNNIDGKVIRTLIAEDGIGLEEGLNSITEDIITSKYLDRKVDSPGYKITKDSVKKIFKLGFEGLEDIILEAELYHDDSKVHKTLGIGYPSFMGFMDKVYNINLRFNKCRGDKQKEILLDELIDLIIKEYMPIRKTFVNKLHSNKELQRS